MISHLFLAVNVLCCYYNFKQYYLYRQGMSLFLGIVCLLGVFL